MSTSIVFRLAILFLNTQSAASLVGFHDRHVRVEVLHPSFRQETERIPLVKHVSLSPSSSSVSVPMSSVEDSEWYVEPPTTMMGNDATEPVRLPNGAIPNIIEIESEAELQEFLSQDDRLCLVKFHATWCKSCQKFGLQFKKLANQNADWVDALTGQVVKKNHVRIASLEWSKSESLCKALGITKLPTVQLYSKSRKLAQISVGASKFNRVKDTVDQFVSMAAHDLDFSAKVEQGASLIESNVLAPYAPVDTRPETASDRTQMLKERLAQAMSRSATGSEQPLTGLDRLDPVVAASASRTAETSPQVATQTRRRWWDKRD